MDKLIEAINCYIARSQSHAYPDGEFDNACRWHPSSTEIQDCCLKIREPSRAYPYSIYKHCFSFEHIANMFGVDKVELRKRVNDEPVVCKKKGIRVKCDKCQHRFVCFTT
jgi:hypothetical protein